MKYDFFIAANERKILLPWRQLLALEKKEEDEVHSFIKARNHSRNEGEIGFWEKSNIQRPISTLKIININILGKYWNPTRNESEIGDWTKSNIQRSISIFKKIKF